MKLMTYNILEGGVGRIDPIAEVIRLAGAQAVILQETTDTELFHRLADRLGMDRFLAENPRTGKACGLLSKLPIYQAVNCAPLDERITRGVFSATLSDGTSHSPHLELIGLHLHSKETHADEAIRLREIDAILQLSRQLSPRHLIAGDFNSAHPDQLIDLEKLRPHVRARIQPQGNTIPREVIKKVLAAGYIDAYALQKSPANFGATHTTAFPAMRVDYCFLSAAMAGQVRTCEIFRPEIGRYASDHYPVVLELEPQETT